MVVEHQNQHPWVHHQGEKVVIDEWILDHEFQMKSYLDVALHCLNVGEMRAGWKLEMMFD